MKKKCCCPPLYPCSEDCTDGVPDHLTVNISGALNDQCSGWPSIDGSYVIDWQACTRWQKSFSTPEVEMETSLLGGFCAGDAFNPYWTYGLIITVEFIGGVLQASVSAVGSVNISGTIYPLWEAHAFKQSSASAPADCCGFFTEDIPYDSKDKGIWNSDYGGDLSLATLDVDASTDGCEGGDPEPPI